MSISFLEPRDRICVALDVNSLDKAISLVETLASNVGFFKIGLELFTAAGPTIVKMVTDIGSKVFLDLKFHDIPNTVARAVSVATEWGVSLLNVHASGGKEMMEQSAIAASEAANKINVTKPSVIAVTVLTSLDTKILNQQLRVNGPVDVQVVHLARMAKEAGLEGVVASAHEVPPLRKEFGQDFLIITPGIRPAKVASHDQKRVMTPKEAIRVGADILVIGRAITGSRDPAYAAQEILDEIS